MPPINAQFSCSTPRRRHDPYRSLTKPDTHYLSFETTPCPHAKSGCEDVGCRHAHDALRTRRENACEFGSNHDVKILLDESALQSYTTFLVYNYRSHLPDDYTSDDVSCLIRTRLCPHKGLCPYDSATRCPYEYTCSRGMCQGKVCYHRHEFYEREDRSPQQNIDDGLFLPERRIALFVEKSHTAAAFRN